MKNDLKTIAAISTPLAMGGIGIVRISGSKAKSVAKKVFSPFSGKDLEKVPGYTAHYGKIHHRGTEIDHAVALVFTAPNSYTGEDVVELSCHGGVYIMQRVLSAVIDAGAVLAQPGEFTRRAFLNGKIDLIKAEAVMNIISASGESAARAALSSYKGALSKKLDKIKQKLLFLAGHLAAWADFPEEDIPEVNKGELQRSLGGILREIDALLESYNAARAVCEGVSTVIAGRTNVGKSTLMNLLSQSDKSIVTPIEGTTRDIVEETVTINGITLRLADTAGIRETQNEIENIGIGKTLEKIESAQLVLAVFDASQELTDQDKQLISKVKDKPCIAIINKSDLQSKIDTEYIKVHLKHVVEMSAAKGEGVESLGDTLAEVLGTNEIDPAAPMLASERQRYSAVKVKQSIGQALEALELGFTLDAVSVSIDEAVNAILELTGERATEAVVDEVFARFCVGK